MILVYATDTITRGKTVTIDGVEYTVVDERTALITLAKQTPVPLIDIGEIDIQQVYAAMISEADGPCERPLQLSPFSDKPQRPLRRTWRSARPWQPNMRRRDRARFDSR